MSFSLTLILYFRRLLSAVDSSRRYNLRSHGEKRLPSERSINRSLLYMASMGDKAQILTLLSNDAEINHTDNGGNSALILAIKVTLEKS